MDPMDTDPPEGTDVAPVAAHPAAPVHYDYQSDAASMLTTPTLQIDVSFVLCHRHVPIRASLVFLSIDICVSNQLRPIWNSIIMP